MSGSNSFYPLAVGVAGVLIYLHRQRSKRLEEAQRALLQQVEALSMEMAPIRAAHDAAQESFRSESSFKNRTGEVGSFRKVLSDGCMSLPAVGSSHMNSVLECERQVNWNTFILLRITC